MTRKSLQFLATISLFGLLVSVDAMRTERGRNRSSFEEMFGVDLPLTMTDRKMMWQVATVFNRSYARYFNLSAQNLSSFYVGPNSQDLDDDDASEDDPEFVERLNEMNEVLENTEENDIDQMYEELMDERLSSPEVFSWSSANEPVEGAQGPLFTNQQIFHRNGELKDFLNPDAEEESSEVKVRELNLFKFKELLRRRKPVSHSDHLKILKEAAPSNRFHPKRSLAEGKAADRTEERVEEEQQEHVQEQAFDPTPLAGKAFGQIDVDDEEIKEPPDHALFPRPTYPQAFDDSPAMSAFQRLIAPPKNRAYDLMEETAQEREQRIVDGLIEREQMRLEMKRQEENEMRAIENVQVQGALEFQDEKTPWDEEESEDGMRLAGDLKKDDARLIEQYQEGSWTFPQEMTLYKEEEAPIPADLREAQEEREQLLQRERIENGTRAIQDALTMEELAPFAINVDNSNEEALEMRAHGLPTSFASARWLKQLPKKEEEKKTEESDSNLDRYKKKLLPFQMRQIIGQPQTSRVRQWEEHKERIAWQQLPTGASGELQLQPSGGEKALTQRPARGRKKNLRKTNRSSRERKNVDPFPTAGRGAGAVGDRGMTF
ncbi:hypothetical protein GUITHDRAFT_144353 [Guillardia theta CCMP2712]|uniref:Uncharacterized protein n=1 Tax=Guillardia theta (strain CCMP2712) TaxID=905079 RepID=L1IPM0_GUITC|nr:hypothetical protein GUITHDRAFT_144353 [Guillardia theta CCMP2712]EKX38236.1 hypothetical protein GUITHDRAFT_144353 [Guillardia theta CCMP2712]|eukprot:XP_005825216.1 hypothetical protein GUITHDRAFT_144353 [Guillardia theta CCMP2712]